MLTGDKRETAINVALLSSIIAADDLRITLDFVSDRPTDIYAILAEAQDSVHTISSPGSYLEWKWASSNGSYIPTSCLLTPGFQDIHLFIAGIR